ncbi:riboflavin synthase [Paenibacillus abyssi]|uniref:Riboflavin synthase n=1 Tax=Paenibacillus abyssi TaxID=1340531 RepID=A0A917FL14_9BACL|nr:riboflavin synthase [Paenibacillus abyssi]GGF87483.1 riboflavin synthase [Paenibacillus abyssi]
MFTGLIEEIGTMRQARQQGEAMVLTIAASKVLQDVKLGDSISVNGVCLTVISYDQTTFSVDVMPQTYRHTNLKELRSGQTVNLERAMQAGGRFGGHIVQGHVDAIGTIISRNKDVNAVVFTIRPENKESMRHLIPQGSVTLDGISLTVVSATEDAFSVSIIPHTLKETALQSKQIGETINIETDILGKYVDHLLHFGRSSGSSAAVSGSGEQRLTAAFLSEHGFL